MLTLRASAPSDQEFLLALYAQTREVELALTGWTEDQRRLFVEMQFGAQAADYRARCPQASFDVIVLDGVPVGRLYVDRRPDTIHVLDITIDSAWQGRGIGLALFAQLRAEAVDTVRSISLYADAGGRAQAWYERLGFVVDARTGMYVHLQWHPGPDVQA